MRRISTAIAAFALAALAAPASARSDAADALAALDDPARTEEIAEMVEVLAEGLLAMPVGGIAAAIRRVDPDAAAAIPPDATLGDVAGGDPDRPRRMGREARIAGDVAGSTARDLAAAMPVLVAVMRDMAAQWSLRMEDARSRHR